ncbi:SNF2 family N-terminal domain-containing protein [Massariosphaeria phaeospora]|uniref:SNF2 family N-terminal domain-containing protein n=1 Tax=Massariosphaeria phaeospora TaxID=100035 RepID=A0A7C8MDV0_9PLEO|nr:SNF2 family N-terminal domain-containing protein [Massariosphaeria phaeospora]
MSSSPRKHRAPFRPVNTLSSPQKPSFASSKGRATVKPATQLPHSDDDENSDLPISHGNQSFGSFGETPLEIDLLGNSSSLFDETHTPHARDSPLPSLRSRDITSGKKGFADTYTMVREREPPAPQQRAEAPATKALQELTNTAPEFGQTSPLKNPLKKASPKDPYAHVFNVPKPGQARPEHHRDHQRIPSQPPPPYTTGNHNQPNQGHQSASQPGAPVFNNAGVILSQTGPPQVGSRYSIASSVGSDILEIPASHFLPRQPHQGVSVPKPMNPPSRSIQPAPRPVYSSMGQANGFQPVNHGFSNAFHGSRQTIILDDIPRKRDDADEDDFDPDAAINAERNQFGAPDMYAYVDSSKASENIKALLEGAFDEDEEKIPRARGRKKKQQQKEDDEANSLAKRLQALEVKEAEEQKQEDEDEEDEEDDGSVEGMKVNLLPHQVDGVAWMIEKETGAHNKRGKLPKGGILADDMGLGKTIQSIAVILSNPRPEKGAEPENKKNKILDTVGKGTLIIAPLALIKQWESEINTKVTKSHALKVLVHHGPSRTKSPDKLNTYDVVVTTYQVLASEYASCGEGPNGLKKGCFAVHWYRTILDEAHTIKNRNAKMTKASYEVRSHYRWCLTGTPMQNNLDELQSLIKFLRIQPYSELHSWKESITGPMKGGRGNLAMKRLQIFLKAFMKRRTKDVLKKDGALNFGGKSKDGENKSGFQIVDRNIETVIGEFTVKERAFYERLSNRAESRLAEMMGGEKTDYIGALVLLLRLRQACNHPNLTKSNVKDDKDALTTGSKSATQTDMQTPRKSRDADPDDLADLLGGLSVQTKRCDICQNSLTRDNAAKGAIRCTECENDLNASQKKSKKHKKHRKHKHKRREDKEHRKSKTASDEEPEASKPSRQRRVIMDSDDEDQGEGEWIASGDEQAVPDLGKAGGTDDENAEGDADTLGPEDSDSFATEDEGTPSKKKGDSFIVHDTDSEDDGPVIRKKHSKKSKVISLVSEDDSASDRESTSDGSDSEADSEDSETGESDLEYEASDLTPSTKIRQLLQILEKETPDHKVIVFSQFTSMLNLIEPFLRRGGYNFTRYDGSMRNDHREASLHKLRNDKRTRVLLCSLKCGSLGLNLTAASRVVIMEPFWNPFVEEQAIDRVHRLNQTVDVTVYRLSIHNSVEERILELQEAKRKLATAALEGGKAIGKLSMKDILALFKRDAEFDTKHVDDGAERDIFARRKVLESSVPGEGSEKTESEKRRKAGSLGFKKQEDSVWGRR